MSYVTVAVAKVRGGNKLYTYAAASGIKRGAVVLVPFAKKTATGFVVDVVKKPSFPTKEIIQVLAVNELPAHTLALFKWLCEFYPDDYGVLAQLLLPSSFRSRPSAPLSPPQGTAVSLPPAHSEQQQAIATIANSSRVLLHGDTGTGKTRVFLESALNTLKSGKSVVIITPEIGLTPQLVHDVKQHLPAPIVLTHSAMTEAKRRQAWLYALQTNTPSVFVGPRSALFLPFTGVGLFVVDEAHDSAYKQTQAPRYLAVHIASKLAELHKAKLVQSTATPNTSDYWLANEHKLPITRLTKLAAGEHRSTIELIDITDRSLFKKHYYISDKLLEAVAATLSKNEQAILFLNRRGSARLVQCSQCGWQALCPTCGIPLTYHHDIHMLTCHSCSFKQSAPTMCPQCGSVELRFKNIGTKSLVEYIASQFPKAKIMRFDTDNSAEEQLHNHVASIKAGEVDIVIGTQLVSKGIDLPNLGLVGVINADTGLNLPDFRAEEVTFQQLYQVVGRVDRGHRVGTALIQTRLTDHPVLQAVLHRDWPAFANYELHKRQQFKYPPFTYLAMFSVSKSTAAASETAAKKVMNTLQSSGLLLQLLGPSPSFFEQRGGTYTWHIVVKSPKRSHLVQAARLLPSDWRSDIDPITLL